jgi:hypothetical protein
MVDYGGRDLGPCATACTNELGGRVVVLGYYPWSQIHSLAKSSQMKAVCAWLSRERLPAVVESFAKVAIWTRKDVKGNVAVVLLNASLNPIKKLSLRVLTEEIRFTHFSPETDASEIFGERLLSPKGYVRVALSDLAPWSVHLVVSGGVQRGRKGGGTS